MRTVRLIVQVDLDGTAGNPTGADMARLVGALITLFPGTVTVTPALECTDPMGCFCWCHVTADTHVPICHLCGTILERSEKNPHWGVCRTPKCPNDNQPSFPHEWAWAHRDAYDDNDLPPWNGNQPIDIELPIVAGKFVR